MFPLCRQVSKSPLIILGLDYEERHENQLQNLDDFVGSE